MLACAKYFYANANKLQKYLLNPLCLYTYIAHESYHIAFNVMKHIFATYVETPPTSSDDLINNF